MSCKGVSKPLAVYAMNSAVSGIYLPVTALGNLLLVVTIIVDPLRELRTRFNLLYLNTLISDMLFGLLIDGYRVWSNHMRALGINTKKEYPYIGSLGQMCHVVFFGSQIIGLMNLTSLFADRFVHIVLKHNSQSYIFIGCLSVVKWALGVGLACLYYAYGYTDTEVAVISSTGFGSGVAVVLSAGLYALAKYEWKKHAQPELDEAGNRPEVKPVKKEKFDSVSQMQSTSHDKEAANDGAEGQEMVSQSTDTKGAVLVPNKNEDGRKRSDAESKLINAEKLLVICTTLFVLALPAFIILYVGLYDKYPSCIAAHWIKSWKMLSIATEKAFNPYICILIVPSFRRGVLHLLRIKRVDRVAPKVNSS